MTCLGCGLPTPNRGRVCDNCLPVFSHDGDSWDHKDSASCALRQKIRDGQRGWIDEDVHDETADPCPHCEKYALDQALAAMQRALRGAT